MRAKGHGGVWEHSTELGRTIKQWTEGEAKCLAMDVRENNGFEMWRMFQEV